MPAKEQIVAELNQKYNSILRLDVETRIIKRDELGNLNFSPIKENFEMIQILLKKIDLNELTVLPLELVNKFQSDIENIYNSIIPIIDFNITAPNQNHLEKRENIINNFNRVFIQFFSEITKTISILSLLKKDNRIDTIFENLSEKKAEAEISINDAIARAQGGINRIDTILKSFDEKAKEAGISKYASIFDTQSKMHRAASNWWLLVIIVILVLIVWFGFYLLNYDYGKESKDALVQLTIARVIIITGLFYAITLCIKNFKAQKHNEVINRHRHNALTTFETFTGAVTNDPQTKNAILLEATHCIFANQNTGFSNPDSEPDMPSKVIEIIKSPNS